MWKTSREAIQQLSHVLLVRLVESGSVLPLRKDDEVVSGLAQGLVEELRRDDERIAAVRQRLSENRRGPRPGSAEFEEQLRAALDEEYARLDLG